MDRGVTLWIIGCVSILVGLVVIVFVPTTEWKYGYYNWYTIGFVLLGIFMFILDTFIEFIKNKHNVSLVESEQ